MQQTVAFTGHRPEKLGGYRPGNPTEVRIRTVLKEIVARAIAKGYTRFISGGALGVDQWAAEAVLAARKEHPGLELVIAVPFEGQEALWNAGDRERYQRILESADAVRIICGGRPAAWKYQKRNEWMVDNADVLVAVWDGSRGGTANCVRYAVRKGIPILRLDPRTWETV